MIKLHETGHLRVCYEPRMQLLEIQWLSSRPITSAEFRESYLGVMDLAERYQSRAWLSDFRPMPVLGEAELRWLLQYWYPRYMRLRLDKVAIIQPLNPLAQRSLLNLVSMANEAGYISRTPARFFATLEEAREWVRNPLVVGRLPLAG